MGKGAKDALGIQSDRVIMTDFEWNYFGSSAPEPTARMAIQRKRGVLVRTNSNRDESTDEWQEQEQEQEPGSCNGDRRTSSLRRTLPSSTVVKKEVNFVSPTKSDADSSNNFRVEGPKIQRQHHRIRSRQNSETGNSFAVQPRDVEQDHHFDIPNTREDDDNDDNSKVGTQQHVVHVEQQSRRRFEGRQQNGGVYKQFQGDNYSTVSLSDSKRDLSRGPISSGGHELHSNEMEMSGPATAGDCDARNTSTTTMEAMSYYSDSTASNSMAMANGAEPAMTDIDGKQQQQRQMARFQSSSWSLSSANCDGGRSSKSATIHDDSRFGTIRSVQSECRTSSTSQLNRSGSLKRIIKAGRSNQSLCSCDAESEVLTTPFNGGVNGH